MSLEKNEYGKDVIAVFVKTIMSDLPMACFSRSGEAETDVAQPMG